MSSVDGILTGDERHVEQIELPLLPEASVVQCRRAAALIFYSVTDNITGRRYVPNYNKSDLDFLGLFLYRHHTPVLSSTLFGPPPPQQRPLLCWPRFPPPSECQ
ncbi:hypothetical protein AVEN_205955-1 [Araneus ventricosus]|uniref:Uncharacterized protein n=1 Tax=Araneus ventricosus TaxID=182803 RepID=A0A4Y2SKQ7_ARAVE|nr:hypothetical protein AVEN_205955-1 [Araneus ventricosus]